MSDIQKYPITQAHQMQQHVQQRHILALMGIEPWITMDAPTIPIASVEMPTPAEPPTLILLQTSVVADIEPTLPLSALSAIPSTLKPHQYAPHAPAPTHNSPVQDDIGECIATDDMANLPVLHSEVGHLQPLDLQPLNPIPKTTAVQRQCQQRHILAMMGIEQWVQPSSPTLNIADIEPLSETLNLPQPALLQQPLSENVAADLTLQAASAKEKVEPWTDSRSDTSNVPPSDTDARAAHEPSIIEDIALIGEDGKVSAATDTMPIPDKVMPFDLQGARYGDWILLVDIHALSHDSQILWQNITQALSLTCETLSFPICNGEDAPYLANASLAGYIFRLSGMSEALHIAALTALPDGLRHPNMINMPTLNDMLADSQLKRQLWQQLAH